MSASYVPKDGTGVTKWEYKKDRGMCDVRAAPYPRGDARDCAVFPEVALLRTRRHCIGKAVCKATNAELHEIFEGEIPCKGRVMVFSAVVKCMPVILPMQLREFKPEPNQFGKAVQVEHIRLTLG